MIFVFIMFDVMENVPSSKNGVVRFLVLLSIFVTIGLRFYMEDKYLYYKL